jgi:hypothetical protein
VGRDGVIDTHDWVQRQGQTSDSQQRDTQYWSQFPMQSFPGYADQPWDDNTGIDGTGNGLYWFWDTMWSEPQS